MKIYGHPWSINTRKVLLVLAEKGQEAELSLVMLPKGEQKSPQHRVLHPFAKVPVLDDAGFVLYESDAINRYLDRKFPSPALVPADERGAARVSQWLSAGACYFAPLAGPLVVETLFRRFLGGETDARVVESSREKLEPVFDVAERALETSPYLAGEMFSLADVYWMPYLEYLVQTGQGEPIARRKHLSAWWERVSQRETWQNVGRSGPQPYAPGARAESIEARFRQVRA